MDITASGAVSAILHLHFCGNNVRRLSRDIELHALDGQIPERILVRETGDQQSGKQGRPNVECYTFQLFPPLVCPENYPPGDNFQDTGIIRFWTRKILGATRKY